MATKIRIRRGTAAEWTSSNPILGLGEMGIEVDTRNFKVGDGLTSWGSLNYYLGYTDDEIDSLLSIKANSSDVYTKLETESLIAAKIFGNNYQYFEDNIVFTTNSNNNQNACQFTTTSIPAGTYRVNIQWNFTINSTTNSAFFELYVDNVLQNQPIQIELKDSTDDLTHHLFQNIALNSGTHTIQLRTRMEGGSTVTIPVIKCDLWRVE